MNPDSWETWDRYTHDKDDLYNWRRGMRRWQQLADMAHGDEDLWSLQDGYQVGYEDAMDNAMDEAHYELCKEMDDMQARIMEQRRTIDELKERLLELRQKEQKISTMEDLLNQYEMYSEIEYDRTTLTLII